MGQEQGPVQPQAQGDPGDRGRKGGGAEGQESRMAALGMGK